MMRNAMKGVRVMNAVALLLVAVGLVESVWGILQLSGILSSRHGLFPLTGSFFNPGPYGCFLAMLLPLAVYMSMAGDRVTRFAGVAYVLTAVSPLSASMSRTGWIAGAAGCGLTILLLNQNWLTTAGRRILCFMRRRPVISLLSGVVVVVLVAMAVYGLYAMKSGSASGRLLMWKIGAQAMAVVPLSGVGWDNVAGTYGEAQEAYFSLHSDCGEIAVAGSPEYLFNEYLQIGVAYGALAFMAFILVLCMGIYRGVKGGAYGFSGSLLAFMTVAFASYPLQFTLFLVCVCAVALCCYWSVPCRRFSPWWFLNWLLTVGACILCVAVAVTRYEREAAREEWGTGVRRLYHSRAYRAAAEGYASFYDRLDHDASFLFEYGHSLHKVGEYEESVHILEKAAEVCSDAMVLNIIGKNRQAMGEYAEAERCFRRSSHRQPALLYPHYLLMKLYEETGDSAGMVREASYLMTHKAKVPSPAEKEMRDEACQILEKSLTLQSDKK